MKRVATPDVRTGTTAIYLDGHEFDDDDIARPDDPDIPLRSNYPAMVEIRDTGGDQKRQLAIAGTAFHALVSAGSWPVLYIDDMQRFWMPMIPPKDAHEAARFECNECDLLPALFGRMSHSLNCP